jgi:hypothetical protein
MWRDRAPTLADLHRYRFEVILKCARCQLPVGVRLHITAAALGWDYVPWGKTRRCIRWRCGGAMAFWCYPPQTNQGVEMF